MSKLLLFILLLFSIFPTHAQETVADTIAIKGQNWQTDSLENILRTTKEDIAKAKLLNELSWRFAFNHPEKGLLYFQQALALSQRLNYQRGVADAYVNAAWCHSTSGNYNYALQLALKSLHLFEELKDSERIAWVYLTLADSYRDFGDLKKAQQMAQQSLQIYNTLNISARVPLAVAGSIYKLENKLDSALIYIQKAHVLDNKDNQGKWGWIKIVLGDIYLKKKQYDQALAYYRTALPLIMASNVKKNIVDIYNGIAIIHKEKGQIDSSIYYANEVLQNWNSVSYQKGILDASTILSEAYKAKNEKDSTIKYLEVSIALNNKLFNLEKQRDIENLAFNEQIRQEEIERERQRFRNQLKLYGSLAFGSVLLAIAVLLWRNNQHRKRAYAILQKQKQETDHQKTKAEDALQELKTTQVQLVQREKLASLGELTAGIAHEIQNPLNFVNNFSEVSAELVEEIEQESKAGNTEEVLSITADLKQNLEKIHHHGKRADSIVKGMLQHSRTASGERQLTDINALVEEYLRLSHHGLWAKDKNFNTTLVTDFDANLGKVEVVPQELGRVLLNLFNNAFYAVQQKKAHLNGQYQPEIRVSTKFEWNAVEILIKDNGIGIAEKIKSKIFQPFFTTKPTGEGTGLGLSLSYDIITKGHGGQLVVESQEGEYTQLIISLPIK